MTTTGAGSYTVTVSNTGCYATSAPVLYTGINEQLQAAGISVYPNPFAEYFVVELNKTHIARTTVVVYNAIGEILLSKEIQNPKTEVKFDFPAGIYSVELKTHDSVYVTRIVKM